MKKIIHTLSRYISLPLYKNDEYGYASFDTIQQQVIDTCKQKIKNQTYRMIKNYCLCNNQDSSFDVCITEKDRYGFSIKMLLCKKCGIIRADKIFDEASNKLFYQHEYRTIYSAPHFAIQNFFTDQYHRGKKFLELINSLGLTNSINTVFEIGCGAGGLLFPFYEIGKSVAGCDFDENYLKIGQEHGLNITQGDFKDIVGRNQYDLIILSHVLEHVPKPFPFISNIMEHIKENGFLLLEVPGIFCIYNTYLDPLTYFQGAHIYNFYEFYLKEVFSAMHINVVYSNERCTFVLQKTIQTQTLDTFAPNARYINWAQEIEHYMKYCYLSYKLHYNRNYQIKEKLLTTASKTLNWLHLKPIIKKILRHKAQ